MGKLIASRNTVTYVETLSGGTEKLISCVTFSQGDLGRKWGGLLMLENVGVYKVFAVRTQVLRSLGPIISLTLVP